MHTAHYVPFFQTCLVALAASCALASTPALADDITIGGTGNALGTAKLLADAYTRKNPLDKITVVPSLGSSGAIKGSAAGKLGLGFSSRALKEEERALGIVATEYARTPTVFAVSNKSKLINVSTAQLVAVYAGQQNS